VRQDIGAAGLTLEDYDAEVASDVLVGIAKTDGRERSSIFSATAGVLAAYNADATRRTAATTPFNPSHFVASRDTVYVTASAHKQALSAPLAVGLLEQVRHATYARAAESGLRSAVFLCLDEVANIAPIHDLPTLVSEAGGQGLHVMACLQDLSQARQRWGESSADGFLSLFQTKLIFTGIAAHARGDLDCARRIRSLPCVVHRWTQSGRETIPAAGDRLGERELSHAASPHAPPR
jgi:type IV secretion system protein VirD4